MTIGDRIKLLRKQRKMSMEDVAYGINVGRATICRYENGQITNIPSDKIEQMATLFSVSPAYLMGWEEDEQDRLNALALVENPQIQRLVLYAGGNIPSADLEAYVTALIGTIDALNRANKKTP